MVISARTAKKLDFSFCGGSAVEIFTRYMSERETQKTAKLQASAVTGFLVWLNGIGETTPTAQIVERYVSEVISTKSKTYAYITTSYLNQFAIFLAKNGFCEVTFWGKKPTKKSQTKTSDIKALRAITDYYRYLEVEETANQEDIKRAYRRMAIKIHPDQNPDDEYANERFCALQRIYEVLSDTTERYDYDVVMGIRDGGYKAHPKKYYRVLV